MPPEYPEQIMFMRKPVSENQRSFTQTHRNTQKINHDADHVISTFPNNDDEFQHALEWTHDYINHVQSKEKTRYLQWPPCI
jgi:hypothetical protein